MPFFLFSYLGLSHPYARCEGVTSIFFFFFIYYEGNYAISY